MKYLKKINLAIDCFKATTLLIIVLQINKPNIILPIYNYLNLISIFTSRLEKQLEKNKNS